VRGVVVPWQRLGVLVRCIKWSMHSSRLKGEDCAKCERKAFGYALLGLSWCQLIANHWQHIYFWINFQQIDPLVLSPAFSSKQKLIVYQTN
jgi:hypothetical protein